MRLENVEKCYDGRKVLDGLTMELEEGKITCIVGKSGAGKTTLLNAIAGVVEYGGEILPTPKSVGYVFQNDRLIPFMTVRENLRYGGGRDELIDEFLSKMGILELSERKAACLSGGEKRRVALARALCVPSAEAVLLDEPFSALDTVAKERAIALTVGLLKGLQKTAVFVTHDLDEAFCFADKIAVLCEGKIVYELALPACDQPRPYGAFLEERDELLQQLKNR